MRRHWAASAPKNLIVGLASLALAASSMGSVATDAAVVDDRLAFVVSEADYGDAPTEIYVAEVGGVARNITNSDLNEFDPAWSPNGRQIAFNGTQGIVGPTQIFVMNADGTRRRRVTRGARTDDFSYLGEWSPNGRKIVYSRSVGGNIHIGEIYVMNADGTRKRRLTHNSVDDFSPFWSSDGRRIVFTRRTRAGDHDVYVVSLSGRGERRLTRTGDSVADDWAPGRQIVFTRSFGGADAVKASGIYVMNGDGTHVKRVKRIPPDDDYTVSGWSRDGALILYYGPGISTVRPKDERVRRLTRTENDWDATWSPDGRQIAFNRGRAIWVMNRDGSRIRQATLPQGENVHRSPAWSP